MASRSLTMDNQRPEISQDENLNGAPPRKRARQSCDACKSRKTKCISLGTGSCQYCTSIGAPCGNSLRQRRRPYYRVSEEEYESCMRLLRHFIPNTKLDLETMRLLIKKIDEEERNEASAPPSEETQFPKEIQKALRTEPAQDLIETDESAILQEELGCMIIDSLGKYRYIGADSSLRFNHAAHAARMSKPAAFVSPEIDPTVMSPLTGTLLPTSPDSLESMMAMEDIRSVYLPSPELCMKYSARFFDEIHCTYWFYSPEQYYTLLDKTIEDRGAGCSPSWLCCLYSVFAICSVQPCSSGHSLDAKSSTDYLSMARSLVPRVYDEADVESVKALAILSLALNSACFSITAYLILGMTVRIAFSLGLHRNVAPRSQGSVERERGRRLWWTIYLLDQEVAIQLGYPCAIVDEAACIQTPLSSEQILNPGSNTPLAYQKMCVSLTKLKKKISQVLYVIPAQGSRRVPFQQVTSCINSLRHLLTEVPSHLRWGPSIAPSHRRAVAVFGLRYWATLIHITRPFLLYSIARPSELRDAEKKRWYDELSNTCIEASENSIIILRSMYQYRLLSSLLILDSGYIQELVQVFLLANYRNNSQAYRDNLEFCMMAMASMDQVGWCGKIYPELTALVNEGLSLDGSGGQGQEAQGSEKNSGVDFEGGFPDLNETFFDQYQNFQFNMDTAQLDVFDTLDFDIGTFSAANVGSF